MTPPSRRRTCDGLGRAARGGRGRGGPDGRRRPRPGPRPTPTARSPPLAGFIESTFSPLLAEVAGPGPAPGRRPSRRHPGAVTAIVMVTALGDVTSAARVAAAVDAGQRVPPLLFFQSVPNAVAGYLAARWQLTGPVVCVSGIKRGAGRGRAADR